MHVAIEHFLYEIHIGVATLHTLMSFMLRIPLNATPEQGQRLLSLQQAFAKVCNALAPVVQQTRV